MTIVGDAKGVIELSPLQIIGEYPFGLYVNHGLNLYARYVISLNVSDYSGQIWLSGFNEAGVAILGHTADEMEKLKSDDDPRFRKIMAGALGKTWQIACRAKSDTFNDVTRVRHSITKITPVDFVAAGKALVEAIAAWGIA